jgi:hypothetical protein
VRRNTAAFSARISAALTARGIEHTVSSTKYGDDSITIDRTSMVQQCEAPDEQSAYDAVLAYVQEVCGETAYVTWAGRTDDYLGVEIYAKDPT